MKIPLGYICLGHTGKEWMEKLRRGKASNGKFTNYGPSFEKCVSQNILATHSQTNEKMEEYEAESLVDD